MPRRVSIKEFIRDLNRKISDDNVFTGAAALGFYLTLALFPALILMMTIIPYLPIERVDEAIMDLLGQALPDEAHEVVAGVVQEVTEERRGGLLSFSLLGTLWAASTGMHAIMKQLNITYDVEEERSFIRARGTALVLSILFILLVIGAFSLIVLGGVLEAWLEGQFGFGGAILLFFSVLRWVIIVLALMLGFAMIYRYAPNVEQKFKFLSAGAIFGVLLLIAASLGFAVYVSNFGDYAATYGSIGAIIILMMWLYIAGLVILVGSEINVLIEHHSATGKRRGEQTERARHGGEFAPRQASHSR
jgi:membrane protein